MSKAQHLEVLPKEQAALVDSIKAYHAGCLNGFKQQMGYAYLAGLKLNALKEVAGHGNFVPLCEKYFPDLPIRTAQCYMKFNGLLELGGKNATVALLPNGKLSKEAEGTVLKAVFKAADGKSLTQMYRDLGVIREKKADGGYRPNAAAVQEWLAANHPNLAGTKFDELPPALQKAFKKQYVPKVDPDALLESKRSEWEEWLAHGARMHDEDYAAKFLTTPLKLKTKATLTDILKGVLDATKEKK